MANKIPMIPDYKVEATVTILAETMDYNHAMLGVPWMWRDNM